MQIDHSAFCSHTLNRQGNAMAGIIDWMYHRKG